MDTLNGLFAVFSPEEINTKVSKGKVSKVLKQ
jgi:hypothetical protein